MLTTAVAVGIAGPGAYSLDSALGTVVRRTVWVIIAVLAALGVLYSVTSAAGRRRVATAHRRKAAS